MCEAVGGSKIGSGQYVPTYLYNTSDFLMIIRIIPSLNNLGGKSMGGWLCMYRVCLSVGDVGGEW